MNNITPILGITASSGTGKTTLLEKLIPALQEQGFKVGVIKHTHHNVNIDHEGKDTWRMQKSGASQVALVSKSRWAIMCETPSPISLTELAEQFDPNLNDLILVEGFKDEAIPKILLHRKDCKSPLPAVDQFTIAIATDYPLVSKLPILNINSPNKIAAFIEEYFELA